MFTHSQYALLDFGEGRKLERFGAYVLDRPAPQAQGPRHSPQLWTSADARFEGHAAGQRGEWIGRIPTDASWCIRASTLELELRLTPFGQVGVFPEQAEMWDWLAAVARSTNRNKKVLNLFAYTGASTLAAASAGAELVHVDASRTAVAWARRNAERSNLQRATIRWIVDDVLSFVRREIRRGHQYDGLIFDPPSFGRGPKGQLWNIDDHFDELLQNCRELLAKSSAFCAITCHTTGWSPSLFVRRVRKHLHHEQPRARQEGWLELATSSGRKLKCGMMIRWSNEEEPSHSD